MTPLIFGLPMGSEWLIIIVALLLIFGGSRIAGIGKGTGRAVREFKEEIRAADSPQVTSQATTGSTSTTAPVATPTVEADPVEAPRVPPTDLR